MGISASAAPASTRSASRRSLGERSRRTASIARRPCPRGVTVAVIDHGPSVPRELTAKDTPPSLGRVRLRLMSAKDHRFPVRVSSTTRLPFFTPISVKSPPSGPSTSSASSQPSSVVQTSGAFCAAAAPVPASAGVFGGAPAAVLGLALAAAAGGAARPFGGSPAAARSGVLAIGRLSAPAKIVSWPSRSTRTAIAAPIRLRRLACKWPVSKPRLEIPTSALGADATTVPSGSRTTMSRSRSAARPSSVRSSCVPPTSMR